MKEYKFFIRKYDFSKNKYITEERIIQTDDIYHDIGYIYCTSLVKIKRIDYILIKNERREFYEIRKFLQDEKN